MTDVLYESKLVNATFASFNHGELDVVALHAVTGAWDFRRNQLKEPSFEETSESI